MKKEWREKIMYYIPNNKVPITKYQKGIYIIGRIERKQINHSTIGGPNKIIHAGPIVSSLSG